MTKKRPYKAGASRALGLRDPFTAASSDHSIDSEDPWDSRQSEDSGDSEAPSGDSGDRSVDSDDPWDTGDSQDTGDGDTDDTGSSDFGILERFVAVIDPALGLSEEAARRIERQLRVAVLTEVAALDFYGEIVVSTVVTDGTRGVRVRRR